MSRTAHLLVLAGLTCLPCIAKADANQDLVKKLQGTWVIVSAVSDGTKAPEEQTKPIKIVFNGNKATFFVNDKGSAATIKVDASKKPVWIDSLEKGAPKASLGIIALEGDTLKMCTFKEDKRPMEFKSDKGSGALLLILKRAGK